MRLILGTFFISACLWIGMYPRSAYAQGDISDSTATFQPSSKGEFYILNWIPKGNESGPLLSQTTLNYEYGTVENELAEQFKFQYYVGDFVFYKGKRYSRKELGEELFKQVRVNAITFKAKVYSEEEYVGEIFIEYPDIIAKSGGQSGWYNVKGIEWDEVFIGKTEPQAKQIFGKGFELKDSEIYFIGFDGMDTIEKVIQRRLDDEKAKQENVQKSYETSSGSGSGSSLSSADMERRTKKKFNESLAWRRIMDWQTDNPSNPKNSGLPYRWTVEVGAKYTRFPINVNATDLIMVDGESSVENSSYTEIGGGYSAYVGGGYWPLYGRYFGVGLTGNMSAGGLPKLYRSSFSFYGTDLNFHTFFGDRKVKFALDYGLRYRYGVYFEESQQVLTNRSSHTYILGVPEHYTKSLGIGAKLWLGVPTFRTLDLKMKLNFMKLNYTEDKVFTTFVVDYFLPPKLILNLEFSPYYPVIGEVLNDVPRYNATGFYLNFTCAKTFDWYGRDGFLNINRGKKVWK